MNLSKVQVFDFFKQLACFDKLAKCFELGKTELAIWFNLNRFSIGYSGVIFDLLKLHINELCSIEDKFLNEAVAIIEDINEIFVGVNGIVSFKFFQCCIYVRAEFLEVFDLFS